MIIMKGINVMTKERSSNIELLRILLAMSVIVLHYNNADIGGALGIATGINYNLLLVLEGFSICAVNTFVLISGYYLCKSCKRETIKAFLLVLQVMAFNLAGYIMNYFVAGNSFDIKSLIIALLPNNYYVILYIAVYFISLYFNVILDVLKEKRVLNQMMIVIIVLLSVEPTIVDLLEGILQDELSGLSMISYNGSLSGYSVVNFALMYLIGAYIRIEEIDKKCSMRKAVIGLMSCVILTSVWAMLTNVLYFDTTKTAWAYSNPIVIFEAVFLFIIFRNIHIGNNRVINRLSKASFTVYLIHIMFLKYMRITDYCNKNVIVLMLHIIVVCAAVYIICWIIYEVYHFFEKVLINLLKKVITFPNLFIN